MQTTFSCRSYRNQLTRIINAQDYMEQNYINLAYLSKRLHRSTFSSSFASSPVLLWRRGHRLKRLWCMYCPRRDKHICICGINYTRRHCRSRPAKIFRPDRPSVARIPRTRGPGRPRRRAVDTPASRTSSRLRVDVVPFCSVVVRS